MDTQEQQNLLVIGPRSTTRQRTIYAASSQPDPVICAQVDGKKYLAVSSLEYGRAEKQADVDELISFDELEINRLARELKNGPRAYAAATANLLERFDADGVAVPPTFGVVYADELRSRGIEVSPDGKLFAGLRRAKTEEEVAHIKKTPTRRRGRLRPGDRDAQGIRAQGPESTESSIMKTGPLPAIAYVPRSRSSY